MSETAAQRKAVLAQYDYSIRHLPGERKCWGGVLSRLMNVPEMSVRAVVVFFSGEPDETSQSENAIREVHEYRRAVFGWTVAGAPSSQATSGRI